MSSGPHKLPRPCAAYSRRRHDFELDLRRPVIAKAGRASGVHLNKGAQVKEFAKVFD